MNEWMNDNQDIQDFYPSSIIFLNLDWKVDQVEKISQDVSGLFPVELHP